MAKKYQKEHKVVGKQSKYILLLQKRYFDTGLGLTNYVKYGLGLLAIDGIFRRNLTITIITAIVYLILCYVLGFLYIKYKWYEQDQEISNNNNLFVKKMLRAI